MTYDELEKFAHENKVLARAIAHFDCSLLSCDGCIFYNEGIDYQCISTLLSIVFEKKGVN